MELRSGKMLNPKETPYTFNDKRPSEPNPQFNKQSKEERRRSAPAGTRDELQNTEFKHSDSRSKISHYFVELQDSDGLPDNSSDSDDHSVKESTPIPENVSRRRQTVDTDADRPINCSPQQHVNNPATDIPAKPKTGGKFYLISIAILLLLVSCCYLFGPSLLLHYSFPSNSQSEDSNVATKKLLQMTPQKMLYSEIKRISRAYPRQSLEVWKGIMAAFTSIMEPEPQQPGVLLMVGPPASKKTIECLGPLLSDTFNLLQRKERRFPINIESIFPTGRNPLGSEELDDMLRDNLKKSTCVVISGVDKLPADAALLLHGYCDNFNAPFKKNVIILTALFDSFESDKLVTDQAEVDHCLRDLWDDDLGSDKSASIVSRISNNFVAIHDEDIGEHCPSV